MSPHPLTNRESERRTTLLARKKKCSRIVSTYGPMYEMRIIAALLDSHRINNTTDFKTALFKLHHRRIVDTCAFRKD